MEYGREIMEGLATEILHELKNQARRNFILLIVCIILLFASNIAWLIAWNLPDNEVTESYELQGEDDANVIYNSQGEVQIDGQSKSEENNGIESE